MTTPSSIEGKERLTIRISEGDYGWYWMLYRGDGTVPGSLLRAESCGPLDDAVEEAQAALLHALDLREIADSFTSSTSIEGDAG